MHTQTDVCISFMLKSANGAKRSVSGFTVCIWVFIFNMLIEGSLMRLECLPWTICAADFRQRIQRDWTSNCVADQPNGLLGSVRFHNNNNPESVLREGMRPGYCLHAWWQQNKTKMNDDGVWPNWLSCLHFAPGQRPTTGGNGRYRHILIQILPPVLSVSVVPLCPPPPSSL